MNIKIENALDMTFFEILKICQDSVKSVLFKFWNIE